MHPIVQHGTALALVMISSGSTQLGAQRIMTSADLPSLTAPPPDQRIKYGSDPLEFGNLRLPKSRGPHLVVVFIHGGCWLAEYDIAHVAAAEQAIADAGYAVWSLEFRRVGNEGGGWPGTFIDIGHGADFLRTVAKQYSLDLNRVVASGHSAGGQLALWLAARKKIPRTSELYAADPLPIRGVLALAAAADLEDVQSTGVCDKAAGRLMGGSAADHPDRYAAASPMRLAPIGVPQVLVVGAHDKTWTPFGRSYYARTRELNDTIVQLVELPESGHFEMIAPASTSWPLVISALKGLFARAAP